MNTGNCSICSQTFEYLYAAEVGLKRAHRNWGWRSKDNGDVMCPKCQDNIKHLFPHVWLWSSKNEHIELSVDGNIEILTRDQLDKCLNLLRYVESL